MQKKGSWACVPSLLDRIKSPALRKASPRRSLTRPPSDNILDSCPPSRLRGWILWKPSLAPCLPFIWILGLLSVYFSCHATWQLQRMTGCQGLRCSHTLELTRSLQSEHIGGVFYTVKIFTAPRPFLAAENSQQRLALKSWLLLHPKPQVVLLGRHPSLHDVAAEYPDDVQVEEEVDTSFLGTPLLNSAIWRARAADADVAVFLQPSLILTQHFSAAIEKCRHVRGDWILAAASWRLPAGSFSYELSPGRASWHIGQNESAVVGESEVVEHVLTHGAHPRCAGADVYAWNVGPTPLHAGGMPPFVCVEDQVAAQWLTNEIAESRLRRLIHASGPVTAVDLSPSGGGEGGVVEMWEGAVNGYLSRCYGSFSLKRKTLSDTQLELVKCERAGAGGLCFMKTGPVKCLCEGGKGGGRGDPGTAGAGRGTEEVGGGADASEGQVWGAGVGRLTSARVGGAEGNRSLVLERLKKVRSKRGNWVPPPPPQLLAGGESEVGRVEEVAASETGSSLTEDGNSSVVDVGMAGGIRLRDGTNGSVPAFPCLCPDGSEGEVEMCIPTPLPPLRQLSKGIELPYDMAELIQMAGGEDRIIVLGVVARNYVEMMMSWACSLRKVGVTNYVLSALDEETYRFGIMQGLPMFRHPFELQFDRDSCHFGTVCFQKLTKVKSRLVLQILKMGYHVLFSDVDVYWFHNPIPELKRYGEDVFVAQSDNENDTGPANDLRRVNSGFYFAHSTPSTISAFEQIVTHAAKSERSEQPSFYYVLCGKGGEHRVGVDQCFNPPVNVTVQLLSRDRYPNGATRLLWQRDTRAECAELKCVVLHNNWVSGRRRKLVRAMEKGLWDYDIKSRMCWYSWRGPNMERIY